MTTFFAITKNKVMADIIVTNKSELESIVQKSVLKALEKHKVQKVEQRDNFLSIEQASNYLQLAQNTLYGFTSKRKIPFIKKGKKLYFKEADLDKWLETGRKKTKDELEKEL